VAETRRVRLSQSGSHRRSNWLSRAAKTSGIIDVPLRYDGGTFSGSSLRLESNAPLGYAPTMQTLSALPRIKTGGVGNYLLPENPAFNKGWLRFERRPCRGGVRHASG
jgi:hypothetical protein